MNRIILIGRLTRDPELSYTQSGIAVAKFTLAVDRPFTNQDGKRVSTHAPARGATVIGAYGTVEATFQPTHPHGVRLTNYDSGFSGNQVSTHAPARGATQFWSSKSITASCFNPRTRTGCDVSCTEGKRHSLSVSTHAPARGATLDKCRGILEHKFQPTHPHGVRLA